MAMEKLNMAARDAQPKVNSMVLTESMVKSYLVSCVYYRNRCQLS